MKYFVYILYSSAHDRFYYGQTQDLGSRLTKHNKGEVVSTVRYVPWELYAYKEVTNRTEAIKIERMLKNLKSRVKVADFIIRKCFVKV